MKKSINKNFDKNFTPTGCWYDKLLMVDKNVMLVMGLEKNW